MNLTGDRIGPTAHYTGYVWTRAIDTLLESAIEDCGVSQVIEVAAGLSPRGWRFARRNGDRLDYIEAAEAALHAAGFASARLRRAADAIGASADPGSGLAHILEASTR